MALSRTQAEIRFILTEDEIGTLRQALQQSIRGYKECEAEDDWSEKVRQEIRDEKSLLEFLDDELMLASLHSFH